MMTSTPLYNLGWTAYFNSSYNTLDAQNESHACCAYWSTPDGASRSITHLCMLTNNVSTGGTITAALETIDSTTGLTSGVVAAGASGSISIADNDDYAYKEIEITTPFTLSSGSWLGVSFTLSSGTGNMRLVSCKNDYGNTANGVWGNLNTGTGNSLLPFPAACALKCSTGEYIIPLSGGCYISTGIAINSGSNPCYVGNKIISPVTVRLSGMQMLAIDIDYNISVKLVDASGITLKGDDAATDMLIAFDNNYRYDTSSKALSSHAFPCPKTLMADTAYYLIIVPETANNITVQYVKYASTALKAVGAGIPTTWTLDYVQSPASVSFAATAEWMAALFPIFNGIDIPAGSGGGPIMGGMVVR